MIMTFFGWIVSLMRSKLTSMLMKLGLEFINKGERRIVFLTRNYAIKIPRLSGYSSYYGLGGSVLSGWLANRTEYKIYKSKKFDFVAPVSLSLLFSFVVIMPRMIPIEDEEFDNLEIFDFGGYEHTIDNVMKTKDGDYTIVDYGNT